MESLLVKLFHYHSPIQYIHFLQYPYFRKMNGEHMLRCCRFFFIDQAFSSKDNDGMNKISEN